MFQKTAIKFILFIFYLCFNNFFALQAQSPPLHTKTEQSFHYVGKDSLPRYFKKWEYAPNGLLIERTEFHYSNNPKDPPATLLRDERMSYDQESGLYSLKKTQYPKDKEPKAEGFKALYLHYDNDPKKCMTIWTKTLDDYGEIITEDTCTYDKDSNLVQQCFYNYKGNTSLFCDHYKYNRKGNCKTWQTYYHWTTVNIKGDIVNKKKRRRFYHYRYNSDGEHISTRGRHYKNRFTEDLIYDEDGRLAHSESKMFYRQKNKKEVRKKTGKRYHVAIEMRLTEFENGRMTLDRYSRDTNELKSLHWEYKDSLLLHYEYHEKGKVIEVREYEYDEKGIPTSKITNKFDLEGKPRFSLVTTFDAKGNVLKETQLSGENVISVLEMEYDEKGLLQSSLLFLKEDVKYERTLYSYSYY